MRVLLVSVLCFAVNTIASDSFKEKQLKYPRVRAAYADKQEVVKSYLLKHNIEIEEVQIYLQAYKKDQKIEVWAKNNSDLQYQLVKTYSVCSTSGELGPKRKQGDLQIPEGFYHINIFNPYSSFHLSLGINYPNTSDRILGKKGSLGGDIFIHGDCVTIGCLPITDDQIKELYVLCVEARNNGQIKIPVTIFPGDMSASRYQELKSEHKYNEYNNLWSELKKANDLFLKDRKLPSITFLENGSHEIN